MSSLDFGTTDEERMRVMQGAIDQLWSEVKGNGKPGLAKEFGEFASAFRATEAEREKQHAQNRWRLNVIIALLAAIASYIAIVVSVRQPQKTEADPAKIFHSQTTQTASAQQAKE